MKIKCKTCDVCWGLEVIGIAKLPILTHYNHLLTTFLITFKDRNPQLYFNECFIFTRCLWIHTVSPKNSHFPRVDLANFPYSIWRKNFEMGENLWNYHTVKWPLYDFYWKFTLFVMISENPRGFWLNLHFHEIFHSFHQKFSHLGSWISRKTYFLDEGNVVTKKSRWKMQEWIYFLTKSAWNSRLV